MIEEVIEPEAVEERVQEEVDLEVDETEQGQASSKNFLEEESQESLETGEELASEVKKSPR